MDPSLMTAKTENLNMTTREHLGKKISVKKHPPNESDRFQGEKPKKMLLGFDQNTFPMIRDEKEERFAKKESKENMDFTPDNGS